MDTTYGLALTCRSLQLVPFCGVVRGQNLEALCSVDHSSREKILSTTHSAGRNINNPRYADDTTLMAESVEELKSFMMKVKQESEKVGLKLNI